MDYALLLVYGLAAVISICFYVLALLIGWLILLFSSRNIDSRYEFLKNMVYGGFGGLIATILYETKNNNLTQYPFWTYTLPSLAVLIGIFILLGFAYIYILELVFDYIRKSKEDKEKNVKIQNLPKRETKIKTYLEDYFKTHPNILVALSLFLILTVQFVDSDSSLNNVMALLSALITYILLMTALTSIKDSDSWSVSLFKIILSIFISSFCAWTILNVSITLISESAIILGIVIFLILMILPGFKLWKK